MYTYMTKKNGYFGTSCFFKKVFFLLTAKQGYLMLPSSHFLSITQHCKQYRQGHINSRCEYTLVVREMQIHSCGQRNGNSHL